MSGWLIISSKQNLEITDNLGFQVQGLKRRHRKKASEIEPGDLLFYYITGKQKLAAVAEVRSFVTEAQDKIWVNLGKDPAECYPWRFKITPQIILKENDWMKMSDFSQSLLHFRKWSKKYWRLGLQGQIHALRDEDTQTLLQAFAAVQQA